MDFWTKVTIFMMLGFSLLGRAFAYVGIPPLKLFIGDITLMAFLFLKPRATFDRWLEGLTRGGPLGPLGWTLLISILYGIFETIYGVLSGYKPLTAIENLVFNIYPLYLFLGIWAGQHWPQGLRKYVRFCAWYSAFYGPAFLIFLKNITWTLPGTDVPIVGQPGGDSFVLMGLLCFEPNLAPFWLPIAVSAFMFLAVMIRAEWLSFMFFMTIWGVLGKKMGRVLLATALVAALLVIGALADVHLPAPPSRGGEVSTREILGRAISSFDAEDAADYSENSRTYAGTVTWRTTWWKAIRESVMVDVPTFLFGHGYGFPLKDLVSYTKNLQIRTPHSIFYFCLGYSGAIGVAIFFSLQAAIGFLFWRTYKLTGQVFGFAFWASYLLSGFFGNVFETPYSAIPFYILAGVALAPGLQSRERATEEQPAYAAQRNIRGLAIR